MKVHFIGSMTDLEKNIGTFRAIVDIIKKSGAKLTREWLEGAYSTSQINDEDDIEAVWPKIYRENKEAVSRADVIVAEISNRSFLVGFQVAYALQMKKPILLLSNHNRTRGALGLSENEEIIKFSRYDSTNLEAIIVNFINENSTANKDLRFNFFIDRKILNYLNWAALQTGDTKSEIIRNILKKEIDKSKF
jgi:hypothetical protein